MKNKNPGQAVIFTCRAAVPENVSDVTLQAIKDNCAITIILKRQLSPFRTAGEALLMPLPLSGVGRTAFASESEQKYLSKCPKFDAATVRHGMTFRKSRSGK